MAFDDIFDIDWTKRLVVSVIPSKIFGNINIHYIKPVLYNDVEKTEMIMWCCDNFGTPNEGVDLVFHWSYVYDPELMFMFTDAERVTLFMLRWS